MPWFSNHFYYDECKVTTSRRKTKRVFFANGERVAVFADYTTATVRSGESDTQRGPETPSGRLHRSAKG